MSAFEAVTRDEPGRLIEAALEYALDEYPALDVAACLDQIHAMQDAFARSVAKDAAPASILDKANQYFYGELGFAGAEEDYYDARNSYLNEVLRRRRGIPISLAVLYRELAEAAGLSLWGINLPGHFFLGYDAGAGRVRFVDAFGGGRRLDFAGCAAHVASLTGSPVPFDQADFPPMTDRQILSRMLRNLKAIYLPEDGKKGLAVQRRIVRLAPGEAIERRDLGVLEFQTGQPMQAMRTLEGLMEKWPPFASDETARHYLERARAEASLSN